MNQSEPLILHTTNAAETEALAEVVGRNLRGGEIIELSSDLGGGKTTFVRGLARGAGSSDHVASPTFTVSREYDAHDGLRIYHFDFYRLQEAGIMEQELTEITNDPKAVTIVEWSGIIQHVLPAEHVRIELVANGDDQRTLQFYVPEAQKYLIEGIQ